MRQPQLFVKLLLLFGIIFIVYILLADNSKVEEVLPEPSIVKDDIFYELGLYADAITLIDANYVREVSSKELVYGSLDGMVSSLDSHSAFLSPEQHRQLQADSLGEFGGLGIKVTLRDKILTVVSPLEGTPAHKAGIMPGDKIIKINDESTKDFNLDDAVEALRGMPGTMVKLTIIADSDQSVKDVEIKRAVIKIESVKYAFMIKDDIGYIRIADFQSHTSADLNKAIKGLIRDGMKGLILDLRNNPGGLLEASVLVCERFLKKPDVIVSTRGRIESQNAVFISRALNAYTDFPIVVMINKGSASASEITAGAIRDNKRGLIVGETSFGKGSVQTVIPMKDNSAIRLTTSYYYTPSGAIIHEKGIVPDIVVAPGLVETGAESEEESEDLKYEQKIMKDAQVNEAINLLNDRDRYITLLAA
ncbi:MAG: S41 family peptidase [Dehalococcoidia bacterium]|nr:MAG: S41 family peptidase [Dehalococcoidia bacterium]